MLPGQKLTLHNPWDAITLFREVEETYFPEIEFIDLNQSIFEVAQFWGEEFFNDARIHKHELSS